MRRKTMLVMIVTTSIWIGACGLACAQPSITLTATIRDFCGYGFGSATCPLGASGVMPDFERAIADDRGLLGPLGSPIGTGRKPTLSPNVNFPTATISRPDLFPYWYTDNPQFNRTTTIPLTLNHIGGGVYEYNNSAFFPIDGQLLGNQGANHNFSFTVELHSTFTFQPGQVFNFSGDDDVWVFINDRLVIDIGGVHGTQSTGVSLDTLGLTPGNTYNFDFFFAERHTGASVMRISTSIVLSPDPCAGQPAGTPCADDSNSCTDDVCNGTGICVHNPNTAFCDDGNACTLGDSCSGGQCWPGLGTPNCDDDNVCTRDLCDPMLGCENPPQPMGLPCGDPASDGCDNPDSCDGQGACLLNHAPDGWPCSDGDSCTVGDACLGGECRAGSGTPNCDDGDLCTDDSCDPTLGCQHDDNSARCNDGDVCTDDRCDPVQGCIQNPADPVPAGCALGCRVTAGGVIQLDTGAITTDPTLLAAVARATFGGQAGAPHSIVGCQDVTGQVRGNWTHKRHSRRGTLRAGDYFGLICGCDDGSGGPSRFDGEFCSSDDRGPGPEPRPSPANIACFTGVGQYNRTNGRRTVQVAFRVRVEDRGEPGAGTNAGSSSDVYRIEIWIPTGVETATQLAMDSCCNDPSPNLRTADVVDGGNLLRGNIQIHPATAGGPE